MTARERNGSLRPLMLALLGLGLLMPGLAGCASSGTIEKPQRKGPLHHYRKARLFFEQGKIEDALGELDRSLALDDSLPQTWLFRGQILRSVNRCEEASVAFRKALSINEYFTEARMYLADCLEQRGDTDGALEVLEIAAGDTHFPFPEKVHFNRAMIFLRQGRQEDAISALREAVALRPRYYLAHFEMGKILEDQGRLGEALAAYRAAEPGFPRDPGFLYRFGFVLYRENEPAAARRALQRVVALSPGSETAERARRLLEVID